MLLFAYIYIILCLPILKAQSPHNISARSLDSILQNYAFRAFVRPKTGTPYDGNVPSNLVGINVSALRLRSGSLKRRGVDSYKEFHIPTGIVEQPYVERLVLVYHNLANWSSFYYPLPGYTYLAPVLGLLAYNASNLSVTNNLPELDIRASEDPILINFSRVQLATDEGLLPICVSFSLQGTMNFDILINRSVCRASQQGHFSIVIEYTSPLPGPNSPPPPRGGGGGDGRNRVGIIVGLVIGGCLLLVILVGILIVCVKKGRQRKRIMRMEEAAEIGVPLEMKTIGNTRLPVATETRTKPVLENQYLL